MNVDIKSKTDLPTYLALGAGTLTLSFSAMYVRWAQSPGTVTGFYRLLISTLILFPFYLRYKSDKQKLSWPNILPPIIGGLCMAGTFSLWNTSLFYTNVSSAAMIGNIAPLWVAIASWGLLRERNKPQFWIGLLTILLGIALIMGGNFVSLTHLNIGDMMAIGSSLCYAAYILVTQWGRKHLDSLSLVWINGASASIWMLIIIKILGQPIAGFPQQTWIIFIVAAITTQTVGYMAISYSLGNLPASVVSSTLNLQPVMTILLAIPLLNELPGILQIVGCIFTLSGVYLINYVYQRKRTQVS